MQKYIATSLSALLVFGAVASPISAHAQSDSTATPIKHVVVIFGENISFDHYWGTYPNATNPAGEPKFVAAPGTPSINGLSGALLTANPPVAGCNERSGPQLHARARSVPRWVDGFIP
jgi:phospholipase C